MGRLPQAARSGATEPVTEKGPIIVADPTAATSLPTLRDPHGLRPVCGGPPATLATLPSGIGTRADVHSQDAPRYSRGALAQPAKSRTGPLAERPGSSRTAFMERWLDFLGGTRCLGDCFSGPADELLVPSSREFEVIPNLIPKRLDGTGSGRMVWIRVAPFLEHMDTLGRLWMAHFGFRNQQVVGSSSTAGSRFPNNSATFWRGRSGRRVSG